MENNRPKEPLKPSSKKKALKDYMRYAGLGTEMMGSLLLAAWLGYKLDKWLHLSFPLFLLILPLASLAVLLWRIIKATGKRNG